MQIEDDSLASRVETAKNMEIQGRGFLQNRVHEEEIKTTILGLMPQSPPPPPQEKKNYGNLRLRKIPFTALCIYYIVRKREIITPWRSISRILIYLHSEYTYQIEDGVPCSLRK